jgi:UDP-glucose 4-epimerase
LKPPISRVAVLGGTGFIGSHLVKRLVQDGLDVLVVARSEARLCNIDVPRKSWDLAICDICKRDEVIKAIGSFKPDAVFHLAADPDRAESFDQFTRVANSIVSGTVNALEASQLSGAALFIYADSSKVYGNAETPYTKDLKPQPICSYAIAKSAAWQMCQLASSFAGLQVCSLRPTFVYGPRQNYNLITYVQDCLRKGQPISLQGGSQTRDLLYVDDVVSAFVAVLTSPNAWGNAIPVGSGKSLCVTEICRVILRILGAQAEIRADAQLPRLTEIWQVECDNADAKALLGWSPTISLEEGLEQTFSVLNGAQRLKAIQTAA